MRLHEHALRRQVVNEMHLRRFARLDPPALAIQTVRLLDDEQWEKEWSVISDLRGADLDRTARHMETGWKDAVRIAWERHSEAITTTLTFATENKNPEWNLPLTGPSAEALTWMEELPGSVIRATQIVVVTSDSAAAELIERAAFHPAHLVSCVVDDAIRIWSDFRIHAEGYGRLVVATNGASVDEVSRCIQRVQELGNYRNLALLGLPTARHGWSVLDEIERSLDETGRALRDSSRTDDSLLASLSSLTARLLTLASETDSRLSATAAYAEIVAERLTDLVASRLPGFQSLSDFTGRRFNPAVRTCRDFQTRLAQVSLRAAQFTALLRARIETHIENQNASLLASMDRSVRMQLRLQHLVEGLSAVAVGYYALGLIGYPLKAAEKAFPPFSSVIVLGGLAPLVAVIAFFSIAYARRRAVADASVKSIRKKNPDSGGMHRQPPEAANSNRTKSEE